jgi:hypothetical protein
MRNNKNCHIIKNTAKAILIVLSLIIFSCSARKNKINHRDLIPSGKLVNILTEVYVADGIRYEISINNRRFAVDSIATFEHIIKKHGFTAEAMERTMKFYFIKKPKKLVKIYDQVLSNLTEMETLIQRDSPVLSVIRENLWKGKEFYYLPETGLTDSIWFDIPVNFTGTYTITLTATIYPDDQSINPRINAWLFKPDSTGTGPGAGKEEHFTTVNFIKDGQPHLYILRKFIKEPGFTSLRGLLFNHDNVNQGWSKHGKIENISINLIRN